MRKSVLLLVIIFVIGLCSLVSYGNSGPMVWEGYPSYEMASVDENSPIEVSHESLTFDFLNSEEYSYAVDGIVTAKYQMNNPTAQGQSVQMAFPFVSSIFQFQAEKIAVLVDEEPVPYDLYFGPVAERLGNLSQEEGNSRPEFREILESLSGPAYEPAHFSDDTSGKLYTFTLQPTTEEMIHFAVSFQIDPEEIQVLSYGFSSFSRDGNKFRIGAGIDETMTLEIYVMGKDLDFSMKAYTDGNLKIETDEFDVEVTGEERLFRDYFSRYIERLQEWQGYSLLNEQQQQQLYRFYAEALDRSFVYTGGCSSENVLWDQIHQDRILLLMYPVEFPPNSEKSVEVRYNAQGSMDSRKTGKPVYSFEYMLHPAKYWKSFKDLDITIMAPAKAPYLIESNIEFSQVEPGIYKAFLSSLPEEDLVFSLYEKEKITLVDRAYGAVYKQFRYLTPVVVVGGVVLVIIAVVIGGGKRLLR